MISTGDYCRDCKPSLRSAARRRDRTGIRTDDTSAGTYWLLTDRLGSVREVLNNSGVIVDTLSYDPFGTITSQSNSAYQGAFTFTGLRLDPATGLLFAKYRFLLPDGQWSGNDLLGFSAGDMNTRRYVGNNGVNLIDSISRYLSDLSSFKRDTDRSVRLLQ